MARKEMALPLEDVERIYEENITKLDMDELDVSPDEREEITNLQRSTSGNEFLKSIFKHESVPQKHPFLTDMDRTVDLTMKFPVIHDPGTGQVKVKSYLVLDLVKLAGFALALPAIVTSKGGVLIVAGVLGLAINVSSAAQTKLEFDEGCYFVALWSLYERNGRKPVKEELLLESTNEIIRRSTSSEVTMERIYAISTKLSRAKIVKLVSGKVTPEMRLIVKRD